MTRLNLPVKALREGTPAIGYTVAVGVKLEIDQETITLCSSDQMLSALTGPVSDAVLQLIDTTDGKIFLDLEQDGKMRRVLVDYDGAVGDFIQQLRMPVIVQTSSDINSAFKRVDKVLPLPPEFEQAILQLIQGPKEAIQWFEDGTFKLKRLA